MRNLRSYQILDYVKSRKHCSLEELQERFGVSQATIYRDAAALVARGALQRVRGGVAALERPAAAAPAPNGYHDRFEWNRAGKERIARKALERVADGDILFLDSSTTVACLARLLADRPFAALTIVTNSVAIVERFAQFPSHWVRIALGGPYDPQLHSLLGQETFRQLDRIAPTKAFVSAYGVDDRNATTNHENQAALLMRVFEKTPQKYLLADRSKFGRTGLYRLAARGAFDEILSD